MKLTESSLIDQLKANKDKGKLKVTLSYGRHDPDEPTDDLGTVLYVDWIHVIYGSVLNIGIGDESLINCTIENEGIGFFNEYIAVKEDGVITYYGDFTVDINEERKA